METVNYETEMLEEIRAIVAKWYNDEATGDEAMSRIVTTLGI